MQNVNVFVICSPYAYGNMHAFLFGALCLGAWNAYDKYLAPSTFFFFYHASLQMECLLLKIRFLGTDSLFLKFSFKYHFWENTILKYSMIMMSGQVANKWVDIYYHGMAEAGKSLQRSSSRLFESPPQIRINTIIQLGF